jgi:thioredoxin family protein
MPKIISGELKRDMGIAPLTEICPLGSSARDKRDRITQPRRIAQMHVARGDNHGSDSCSDGTGEVRQPRMYQLVRQKGPIKDVTFEIEFLDPGVEVFSFTFG